MARKKMLYLETWPEISLKAEIFLPSHTMDFILKTCTYFTCLFAESLVKTKNLSLDLGKFKENKIKLKKGSNSLFSLEYLTETIRLSSP